MKIFSVTLRRDTLLFAFFRQIDQAIAYGSRRRASGISPTKKIPEAGSIARRKGQIHFIAPAHGMAVLSG